MHDLSLVTTTVHQIHTAQATPRGGDRTQLSTEEDSDILECHKRQGLAHETPLRLGSYYQYTSRILLQYSTVLIPFIVPSYKLYEYE